MIITKLVLHNFGVYAGTNEFEFKSKKPIVLIGGLNGRGKTTFLEAVLLALYGQNSFAYSESRYRSYNQYLRSYVNKTDNSLESYVEIEFSMETACEEIYKVKREWDAKTTRTSEKVNVLKNGEYNKYLSDNWTMFMENILPSGLSNFFFFDGEKIAEIAVQNTDKQMVDSIKSLLGISVLDTLENDLKRMNSLIAKQKTDVDEIDEIEELRCKKSQAEEMLNEKDSSIEEIKVQIEVLNKKLEKKKQDYSLKGGDIVLQRQSLYEERVKLKTKIDIMKEVLLEDAATELPLILVKDLLVNIREEAEIEHDVETIDSAITKMKELIGVFAKENQDYSEGAEAFVEFFKEKSNKNNRKSIYNLSAAALYQLQNLLDERLLDIKLKVLEDQQNFRLCQEKIDEIDKYLSVDIDENSLAKIYREIKILEQEIIVLEVKLDSEYSIRKKLNGDAMALNTEFNRKVESYLKCAETNDDNSRIQKYSHLAIAILEEYKVRLQKRKTEKVAETMTSCYKKLANKKSLIDKIVMNAVTLEITYLSADNVEVPKNSLSAGEKQLMVISMLWALAICSKKKLPVIIDTPLSRMDSMHRISIIKSYFPNASNQTIILSTDSEINKKYYEIMKENVGDEFTLHYNDLSKSTTISRGYLLEDES